MTTNMKTKINIIAAMLILLLINTCFRNAYSQFNPDISSYINSDGSGNFYICSNGGSYEIAKVNGENDAHEWECMVDMQKSRSSVISVTDNVFGGGWRDSSGNDDILICKIDKSNGNLIWKSVLHSEFDERVYAMVTEGSYIYIAGYRKDEYGYKDALIAKYDTSGTEIWVSVWNNNEYFDSEEFISGICISGSRLFAAGEYTTESGGSFYSGLILIIDKEDGTVYTSSEFYQQNVATGITCIEDYPYGIKTNSDAVSYKAVISGYRGDNNYLNYWTAVISGDELQTIDWQREFNGKGNLNDVSTCLCVDPVDANITVSGYSRDIYNSDYDYMTIRYDENGAFTWNDTACYFNGPGTNSEDMAADIKRETGTNNVIVTGTSSNSVDGFAAVTYTGSSSPESEPVKKSVAETISEYKKKQTTEAVESKNSCNYPNPFNSTTTISYKITTPGNVTITLYNLLGREVSVYKEGFKGIGESKMKIDLDYLNSGVYFYEIKVDSRRLDFNKMTLLK